MFSLMKNLLLVGVVPDCFVVAVVMVAQVAGVFTNLFGGVAGSRYGLRCTLLTSLVLQVRASSMRVG